MILLGSVFAYCAYVAIQSSRKREKSERGSIGCLSFALFFVGFLMYVNARDFVWRDSYSINREHIERSHYTNVWKTNKVIDRLEWSDVSRIDYSSEMYLESTTWVQVNPVTRQRVGQGQWEEGIKGRALYFVGDEKIIELVLEKESYGSPVRAALDFVFGGDDYNVSPGQEAGLKAAISKVLPEAVKEKMSPAARAYFAGEAGTTRPPPD